ncbi:hypothetical protein [Celeribacter neptunius]|uniref:Uncharacterized protein n=1 Tax=Celeribacter neptunius TaxID=588602 RepID=A0A1I3L984_9RHOB|nr:hypothetical protein [Celeribacter neptunius]SFI81239.1 hypothetical protein SAMN04487991_0936 [Celeribacter neptunius]
MSTQVKTHLTSFQASYQGRAPHAPLDPAGFRHRMRLPIATLGLGLVAALAIAGGALDRFVVGQSVTGGLSELEFLTGELPPVE